MSLVNKTPQFDRLESGFQGLQRVYNLTKIVNGGIDLGISTQTGTGSATTQATYTGNLNGQWANVTAPGVANTEFAIPHNLNRIPSWYIFIADRSCNLYQLPNTGTAWTTTNIYLKCDTASAVLRIFIG